jgi:hypothetical protein
MSSMEHRRAKRHQSYVKKLTVRIGGADGTIFEFHDRLAWALLCLIKAGEAGVAPLGTVLELRGPYASRRGRYVLRRFVEIIDREDAE